VRASAHRAAVRLNRWPAADLSVADLSVADLAVTSGLSSITMARPGEGAAVFAAEFAAIHQGTMLAAMPCVTGSGADARSAGDEASSQSSRACSRTVLLVWLDWRSQGWVCQLVLSRPSFLW
jgi:hypothetical protein